ncbi:CHAD domain-containing protein [Streptomyces sp. NBC_00859]|uniref:CHAD domain-containing protein n=1 Tax=Streptomyces sp. NBC_00859 TaxID=2903682 RepID=UPI003870A134|nr:CHAD domain-containing protein [Streptomyces sp. NBC_00859]
MLPGGAAVPRPDPTATAGELLSRYLHDQAAEFLRSLRTYAEGDEVAARALRRSARRIGATLHTFRGHLDAAWADQLRSELAWLSGTLAREHTYAARLARLLEALSRLSDDTASLPAPRDGAAPRPAPAVGAARAGALLERQLTLARTRAHSAALQALGSSRFHAVADAVALLASEVPFAPAATTYAAETLPPAAGTAGRRLADAVAALPLHRAAHPYNAEGLSDAQDAPWHQVRLLLRLHRYAQEALHAGPGGRPDPDPVLFGAGRALDQHREAAEAAGAAASAARTPRIAPATAYALGVLHADQRHEVEAARYAFQQTWQRTAVSAAP